MSRRRGPKDLPTRHARQAERAEQRIARDMTLHSMYHRTLHPRARTFQAIDDDADPLTAATAEEFDSHFAALAGVPTPSDTPLGLGVEALDVEPEDEKP